MALSLSHFPITSWLLLLLSVGSVANAKTVTYDWNITWVNANPDGAFDRPTIGINNAWPIPRLEADVGDRVIVNVLNLLGNQTTTLHFHGYVVLAATISAFTDT
jgi:iron transport multicopper oxidase